MDISNITESINEAGVGTIPTDTIYGLVGSALHPDTIARIYQLKRRHKNKPLIVLIADIDQLEQFGIELSERLIEQLKSYWPGAYSIILPTIDDQFEYLSRNTDAIAFRLPDNEELRDLIRGTGPIVAPSANVEGLAPATTIEEARKHFGTDVDFYIDGGELTGKPSTLLEFDGEEVSTLRD
jgi:L-threonylcarbamoyladenylate synthase